MVGRAVADLEIAAVRAAVFCGALEDGIVEVMAPLLAGHARSK